MTVVHLFTLVLLLGVTLAFESPLPVCQPPAPICRTYERPSCEFSLNMVPVWYCKSSMPISQQYQNPYPQQYQYPQQQYQYLQQQYQYPQQQNVFHSPTPGYGMQGYSTNPYDQQGYGRTQYLSGRGVPGSIESAQVSDSNVMMNGQHDGRGQAQSGSFDMFQAQRQAPSGLYENGQFQPASFRSRIQVSPVQGSLTFNGGAREIGSSTADTQQAQTTSLYSNVPGQSQRLASPPTQVQSQQANSGAGRDTATEK